MNPVVIVGIIIGVGVLLVCLMVFIFFVAFSASHAEKGYKRDAYRLLDQDNPNAKEVEQAIKRLSPFEDEEARELVRRLMSIKK